MTVEKCIDHCSSKGYSHAGLQWKTECFCGNSVDKSVLGSVQCTLPCGGDSSQYCGGSQKLSIYRKGTSEPVPKPAATSTTKTQPAATQKAPEKPTTTAKTQPTKEVVIPKPDSEGSGPKPDPTPASPTCTTKDVVATYCEQRANTNSSFCRQYRQIMKA